MCRILALAAAAAFLALPALAETRLVTLGTGGGPIPRVGRAQSSNALEVNGAVYLIDAGDGLPQRLAAAHIPLGKPQVVFLTHLHLDHTAALPTFLGLRWMTSIKAPVTIIGPVGAKEIINGYLLAMRPALETQAAAAPTLDPAALVSVKEIAGPGEIYADANVTVTAVENAHFHGLPKSSRARSYSYRFQTPDKVVVFTGDTGPSDNVAKLAEGADILVSEVTDAKGTETLILRNNPTMPAPVLAATMKHIVEDHMTPDQVGALAAKAHVKAVVLSHLSPGMDGDSDAAYADGVKAEYDGPVTVAHDLMVFP